MHLYYTSNTTKHIDHSAKCKNKKCTISVNEKIGSCLLLRFHFFF